MDSKKTRFTKIIPHKTKIIGIASVVLLCYGLFSLLAIYGPVLRVEAKYQFAQVLRQFGAESILQLVVPNLTFDQSGITAHREYGIVIPKLGLNEPVVFTVDATNETAYTAALKQGIAHAAGTSIPDMGGLGYYFAHSSSPALRSQFNAVFYLLGKLKGGEDIFIWHDDEKYHYRVTSTKITKPNDVSFFNEEYTTETIVLQTCWPPGSTSQRLLVFAERVLN